MSHPLPSHMTAITAREFGGPEVLCPQSLAVPSPGPGEVLIRVAAAGLNRPDVVQREGHYPPPPGAPDTLGLEIAGVIVALGDSVSDIALGDQVCALVAGGGYAEYCLAPAAQVLPVPAGFSMVEAAAIPETFFTVWSNLFDRARLRAGETLLVHGGTSGIGTTAITLAKALGAYVLTTAGSDEKCAACLKLGADLAINYRNQDFVEAVKTATHGKGVDVILDMVGGDYTDRNLKSLGNDGRLVQIAFLQGPKVAINLLPVMLKRLTITGSTLRNREIAFKGAIAAALREHVWPLFEAGKCRPVIDSTFPLKDVINAHRRLDEGAHIGKIVLTLES
ncbi:NAD(P)H-quinone oxidoreductase [Govanella unica]|uniref:NAD(P)H-quinone oxidoreductase n=1 Tax=Govanella unica TaxID=2975056 RepID=A0A9X3TZL9_9PROT|nr:NAD(P)H-quinone oxidoreductase [Govania unica]MDA5194886.1 NAD(P)H-quinone oxidoreductase [Govania unica]